jgi:hypothetical protein
MAPNRALDAALALWRAPRLARMMRSQPLPEGLTLLLRIVSGELEARAEAQRLTRLDEDAIIAVAELYVLRIMLFRGAPPRRILGVESGSERNQIRRHMGYLMSWLHPDRSVSPWRASFAHRVLDAWHRVDREAEEGGPQPQTIGPRNRRPLFLMPWIAVPPKRAARIRFLGVWRKLRGWEHRLDPDL